MQARQVQVRGCLPALVALVILAAVLAAVVTAGVAFAVVAAVAGLLAVLVRRARGLARSREEKTSEARRRAADVTIDAEVIEPSKGPGDRPRDLLE